jgi:peptidoglycan/xylan/chitin deacetylase (PgdA/CDA1 family)
LAKTGIAAALHWSGTARLLSAAAGWQSGPRIVTYHQVVEDFAASAQHASPSMLISSHMLEQHLDWIGRRFRFVSLDELASHLEGGRAENAVAAVTFDDGYRDVYQHAYPLLKRKGIPSAVFVVTDLVGTSNLQLHDRLYFLLGRARSASVPERRRFGQLLTALGARLPEVAEFHAAAGDAVALGRALLDHLSQVEVLGVCDSLEAELGPTRGETPAAVLPLTWEMLAEMHRGGVTIGSHTRTHALLTNEPPQRILDEAAGSRRELERRLGITVDHFAYPAGRFDSCVVSAVAASGYRFGYTTCCHRDRAHPLLTIPRRVLWQGSCLDALGRFSSTMMSCQVKTPLDFRTRCREKHDRRGTPGDARLMERRVLGC